MVCLPYRRMKRQWWENMYNIIAQQHQQQHLVDVAQELATNVLATGLLVVEDTRRGGLWQESKFNVH